MSICQNSRGIYILFTFILMNFINCTPVSDSSSAEKRSPFLRLDELSNKVYLAKNRLGGGLVDPLEIGKRSPFLRLDELSNKVYLAKNRLGGGLLDPLEIGKRSPFLRLDELSNKVYLAKNRLGGGLVDPLEIGKRYNNDKDDEAKQVELATTLHEGFETCGKLETCQRTLKFLLENYK